MAVENDDGNISYDFSKRKKEKRFMLCDITIVAIGSMRETTITHVNEQIIRIFLPFLDDMTLANDHHILSRSPFPP